MIFLRFFAFSFLVVWSGARPALAQTTDPAAPDSIRVTISLNSDGSRTTYQFDEANHTAVATTTERDGRIRGTIRYTLDDAGRFSKGDVFGPDDRMRFKAVYKYDHSGRLTQELHLGKDDAVLQKIIYSYDAVGRKTSYSVYDASGKMIGRTQLLNSSGKPVRKKSR
jgi:hypothetical protein